MLQKYKEQNIVLSNAVPKMKQKINIDLPDGVQSMIKNKNMDASNVEKTR